MQTDARATYKRDWMRRKRADGSFKARERAREAELARRKLESAVISEVANRLESDHWPLMQGYKAGERGQKCDPRQTREWKRGWQLWNARHGRR